MTPLLHQRPQLVQLCREGRVSRESEQAFADRQVHPGLRRVACAQGGLRRREPAPEPFGREDRRVEPVRETAGVAWLVARQALDQVRLAPQLHVEATALLRASRGPALRPTPPALQLCHPPARPVVAEVDRQADDVRVQAGVFGEGGPDRLVELIDLGLAELGEVFGLPTDLGAFRTNDEAFDAGVAARPLAVEDRAGRHRAYLDPAARVVGHAKGQPAPAGRWCLRR